MPIYNPAPHNILSSTHTDAVAGTAARGDVIVGNSTPKLARLAIGTAAKRLRSDGTDAAWSFEDATTLTSNTTLTDAHEVVFVNAGGATPITITLPTAVGRVGKRYLVMNIGFASVKLATTSSEELDGSADGGHIDIYSGAATIISDGTAWWSNRTGVGYEPRNYQEIIDHFQTTGGGGSTGVSNTGSGTGAGTTGGIVGSYNLLSTGTTTTGFAANHLGVGVGFFGTGLYVLQLGLLTDAALSDGTNRYTLYAGFGDAATAGDNAEGCYFRYVDNVNAGKWEIVSADNSVRTAADSGVAVAASTYYTLRIVVNGEGTPTAYFWIGDVYVGSVNTNVPTNSARPFAHFLVKIEKSLGTTARFVYLDYYKYVSIFTAAELE